MRGQPASNIGAESNWLQIDTPEAGYAGSVVTLVARIARTPSGRAILERIRASGASVKIERPDPPTDPPNAWTRRRGPEGRGTEIAIAYDPADWPSPARPGAPPSDVVLFGRLLDAALLAAGAAPAAEPDSAKGSALDDYLRERTATPEPPARTQP